jgi:hypothetical protein
MSTVLGRARAACGRPIAYKLGMGGMKPTRETPGNSDGQCDCSGFVAWCLGISRQTSNAFYRQLNGGWIETTAVVADALKPGGIFSRVDAPQPGDVLVWGDRRVNGRTVQGHIGIVAAVAGDRATRVIHCSSSNFRNTGCAVRETGTEVFYSKGAICARYVGG